MRMVCDCQSTVVLLWSNTSLSHFCPCLFLLFWLSWELQNNLPGPEWVVLTSVSSVLQKHASVLPVLCVCLPFRSLCVLLLRSNNLSASLWAEPGHHRTALIQSLLWVVLVSWRTGTPFVLPSWVENRSVKSSVFSQHCRRLSGGAGVSLRDL